MRVNFWLFYMILTEYSEKNNTKKEYAKRYLIKYIKELKVHFDLDDDCIKDIIKQIHYSKNPFYLGYKKIMNKLRKLYENIKVYTK